MSELTPITRVESYLDAIVNNGIPPTEDITRIETFLQAIYDNQVCALTPITRIEMFLGKISGQDIVLPEPVTRVELYLAAIAGEDVELPENPITRLEMYLAEWADSGDLTTISGAIVEFITQRAHKLKSCVVTLEPKQDLSNGDPSPTNICPISGWTGCEVFVRSKNLFDKDAEGKQEGYALDYNTGNTYHTSSGSYSVSDYIPIRGGQSYIASGNSKATDYCWYDENKGFISGGGNINSARTAPTNASFARIDYWRADESFVQFELGATASAYEQYRGSAYPVTFGVVGKNLFNKNSPDIKTGWAVDPNNGNVYQTQSGTFSLSEFISVKGGLPYIISGDSSSDDLVFYDASKTFIIGYGDGRIARTAPDNAAFALIDYRNANENTIQFEQGSSASAYEPYTDEVYGATPDIVSGEMPITMAEVDMGTLNWLLLSADKHLFYAYVVDIKENTSASAIPNLLSDRYKTVSASAVFNAYQDFTIGQGINGIVGAKYVMAVNTAYSDAASFKTAMSGVQLVYELAAPVETAITPQQITALKGYNAMWSNAGDIEVTVRGTSVELSTLQALNMLLGGAYHNGQTADDVPDEEALEIILGGENR